MGEAGSAVFVSVCHHLWEPALTQKNRAVACEANFAKDSFVDEE